MQEARAWQQRRQQQHQPPLPLLLESPSTNSAAGDHEQRGGERDGDGGDGGDGLWDSHIGVCVVLVTEGLLRATD